MVEQNLATSSSHDFLMENETRKSSITLRCSVTVELPANLAEAPSELPVFPRTGASVCTSLFFFRGMGKKH